MKFIQVGVGGFGRVWADVLKQHPDADVVGLVDISEKALAECCEKHGYGRDICYPDLATALREAGADAVVSATPPARHRADVVAALKAGLHVISEKPMADTLANCRAMLRAAEASGKMYVVSQNYRYNPVTWTMAEVIRSGRLGQIGQVKIDFFKGVDFRGGFRHEMDYPVIVDMSIHHFDLLRFITGLDAVRVSGHAWNPFWSNYKGDCSSTALFELSNGARALYNASWCAKGDFCSWDGSWQIECEKGTLIQHKGDVRILWTKDLYAVEREEAVPLVEPPKRGQGYVLDEFIRAAAGAGPRPATAVEDNIKSVSMVFATVKAMASGRPVRIL
jgi:predicted dehydrogenase